MKQWGIFFMLVPLAGIIGGVVGTSSAGYSGARFTLSTQEAVQYGIFFVIGIVLFAVASAKQKKFEETDVTSSAFTGKRTDEQNVDATIKYTEPKDKQ